MVERDMKRTQTGHSNGTSAGDISRAHALLTEGCPNVPGDTSGGTNGQGTGTVHASRVPSRANNRREQILAAVAPGGVTIAQLAAKLFITRPSAEQRLREYAKAGLLFMARVARNGADKAEGWYFRDKAERDAVQAQCNRKRVPQAVARHDAAVSRYAALSASNPNGVVPTRIESEFRHRHSVDARDLTERPFGSLRPGQYLDRSPSAWVKAVTA